MVLLLSIVYILLSTFVGVSKLEDNMKTTYFVVASVIMIGAIVLDILV